MKRTPLFLLGTTITCALSMTACDGGGGEGSEAPTGDGDVDSCEIDGDITQDTTWSLDACEEYSLATDTLVFVRGATLRVEPGVVVRGSAGSALVIEKDARLVAEGSAEAPIVFTSFDPDNASPGDWGGIVLLGEATINIEGGTALAEGFPTPPSYGGTDDSHDCGSLRYVRVEYAGFAISEGNELNGITFYACGTDTSVSYVQSHMGLDDGIEMFGGSFDADHIVVTGASDDSLDMDQGFHGKVSDVFIQQNPLVGDNCFEVSNQGTDFGALPKTEPTICNATCVGSGAGGDKSKGITIKEGTYGHWYNSAFTNLTNEGSNLADEATFASIDAGNITIHNNNFDAGSTHESGAESLDSAGWDAWVNDASRDNTMDDLGLDTTWGAPSIVPTTPVVGDAGSPCGTAYVGAADTEDWTTGWVNWVG